jgi:hypothetical protein
LNVTMLNVVASLDAALWLSLHMLCCSQKLLQLIIKLARYSKKNNFRTNKNQLTEGFSLSKVWMTAPRHSV